MKKNPRLLDDTDGGDSIHQCYNSTGKKVDSNFIPNPNPRTRANFFSKLFLCWLTPFIRLGNKRELQVEDLYRVLPSDESEKLGLKLHKEWIKELHKVEVLNIGFSKKDQIKTFKPSLTRALRRTFGPKLALLSLWAVFEECLARVAQPLFLSSLIRYFDSASGMSATEAYMYATGVFICCVSCAFTRCLCYEARHLGLQVRIALRSLMFKKCLLLSQKSIGQDTSIGQIVNLMTNDVSRFDDATVYFNYLWVSPIQVIIATTILYFVLGSSCFIGLLIIFLHAYFQWWSAKTFSKWRLKTALRTDERIRTTNEIITGIRLIKLFTWEKPFSTLVDLCRKMEVSVIRRVMYFRGFIKCLCEVYSKLMVFFIFVVYRLLGYHLTPEKVFLTVALLNEVRSNMAFYFSYAVTSTAEARVSIKRIQEFLLLDEIPKKKNANQTGRSQRINYSVSVEKVTAKWPSSTIEGNTLTDLSFTAEPGQLISIVGQVGSGKSSLLNAILGELPLFNGNCQVNGKVAYASQEAWIFSGTIRENILCGTEYNEQRYRRVVEVTALARDFNLLPKGDQSLVGERGISLSGGQKARVNLARCLYVDADVYLMDDPLSAVDNHVGRHLFNEAINGFLKDKTRILVTHQLQYLKGVDKIIVLREGKLEAFGNPEELLASGHIDARPSSFNPSADEKSNSITVNSNENDDGIPRTNEFCHSGGVTMSTYWKYLRSGTGSLASLMLLATNFLIAQILNTGIDYWLNVWTNAEFIRHKNSTKPDSAFDNIIRPTEMREVAVNKTLDGSHNWIQEVDTYTGIYVYSILIGIAFTFTLIRSFHFFKTCMSASVKLHDLMFNSVVRSPLSFFERNPVGRILNRFSMDIGCMDDQLPGTFLDLITGTLRTLGLATLITMMNWWLLFPAILLIVSFCRIRRMFFVTSLNIRRLEALARSPVFTHLSSSLVGLTTLRAHQCETIFEQIFDQRQDVHSSAFYLTLATARWFAIMLDWTMVAYLACITYGCVALHKELTGSEAGLIISSVMFMATTFNYGVQMFVQVENMMTSTERVIEYCHLPSEAALESYRKPPSEWPKDGSIQFERLSLSYSENNRVLNNITCHIKAKEKIGIVGRTGAGKSSLIAALFRLTEPDGKINIDGIDTKSIGLHDLRSKISIIPQDPILFTGTLRKNLDPFEEFDDDVLWNALEDVKLKESMVTDAQLGLDFLVAEGGSNLSVGQRQLVCLARTIFRKNRILVLDEATANVDQTTDRLIQMTIREKFSDCTVLTIAHRLDTVMDSDKVMVLDAGYLMEFDSPANLIRNKESMFYRLVEQSRNRLSL